MASIIAKIHVVAPTRVTPIDLPLRSASLVIAWRDIEREVVAVHREAMNRMGTPVARKTGTSVAPLAPIWSCPAITAFTRSGPPRRGWNSTVTPWARKNPFSRATRIGVTIE